VVGAVVVVVAVDTTVVVGAGTEGETSETVIPTTAMTPARP
jgi:hypothetical protein